MYLCALIKPDKRKGCLHDIDIPLQGADTELPCNYTAAVEWENIQVRRSRSGVMDRQAETKIRNNRAHPATKVHKILKRTVMASTLRMEVEV